MSIHEYTNMHLNIYINIYNVDIYTCNNDTQLPPYSAINREIYK
jgi:S-adenosylmethionine/arginine decarboxylase-like enzyme